MQHGRNRPGSDVGPIGSCFLAHSANDHGAGVDEQMADHVGPVSIRAAGSARWFGAAAEAEATGKLHDIGKYSKRFQDRLKDPRNVTGVDHWTLGALLALLKFQWHGFACSAAIAGHHVGMGQIPSRSDMAAASEKLPFEVASLGEFSPEEIVGRFRADGFKLHRFGKSIYEFGAKESVAQMLNVRMLFSTLVDADFIETEAHFAGSKTTPRVYRDAGSNFDFESALNQLSAHLARTKSESIATERINGLRNELFECCSCQQLPGAFTLTAPTGFGKTLSMLQFALKHAAGRAETAHPVRRIITVLPFLSIIGQTCAEYRRVFADVEGLHKFVVEDHSLSEPKITAASANDDCNGKLNVQRVLVQNWDAPLIVTTSVQFLESLFANRPSSCRKLHNISNSVILFDEVQTLPPKLLTPTLAAISHLVDRFNCTVVFATATQPAFDHLHEKVKAQCCRGWQPTEINTAAKKMFKVSASRTRVDWRLDRSTSWTELAEEIKASKSKHVLVIVNLKRHARDLTKLLAGNLDRSVLHLSTNLCPSHRKDVLETVRRKLKDGSKGFVLVATQCIEAGVDVSFQRVYRALAPLDAIAQAAGRCNRGGEYGGHGFVTVFEPERSHANESIYPPGYGDAASVTRLVVNSTAEAERSAIIHSPETISEYYRTLYDLTRNTQMSVELEESLDARNFESVAKQYRLIPNSTVPVLVPYAECFSDLRAESLSNQGIQSVRNWVAKAVPLSVAVQRRKAMEATGLEPVFFARDEINGHDANWYVLRKKENYDNKILGLTGMEELWFA